MIDHRSGTVNFKLGDMGIIYDQSHGQADQAHRHDYYTLLLVEQARGEHIIDYNSYAFHDSEVHFVGPGQVHQVVLTQKPIGRVLTFTKLFLIENNIPTSFISNINLFRAFGDAPPLSLDPKTSSKLWQIISDMDSCSVQYLHYQQRALGALLQLFLIYCNNAASLDQDQIQEKSASICILRDFKALVEKKYTHYHKVNQYASELNISAKHLSQMVKDITGKAAKDHIIDRLILEGKRLLIHTVLSIKEIAYELGFEEPLYFSSFFKKHVGTSPQQFKQKSS